VFLCALLCCGCAGNDAKADAKNADLATTTQVSGDTVTSTTEGALGPANNSGTLAGVKVEVYHFHGNSQCPSCIAVGAFAETTVNRYYLRELASGRMVFGHVNYELPENKALAEKYGVTGSSLWIGTYVNGKFSKEEDIKVWYRIDNETAYSSYLRGVLDKRLTGDLS
jgi:hypothetical protein